MPQAPSSKDVLQSEWIVSAGWHLGYILWAPIGFGLIMLPWSPEFLRELTFVISIFLSGGHLLAHLALIITNRDERQRVLNKDPWFAIKVLFLILTSTAFYLVAWLFFSLGASQEVWYLPLACVGAMYLIWNSWHFANQQFGLIQVYKKRAGLLKL